MPEHTDIIKRPIVTEKSTNEINKVRKIRENGQRVDGEPLNRYTFEVARDARKPEIKAAVEAIYGVRVTKVRTQTRPATHKRTRFGLAITAPWKRATVELHKEDRIELF